MNAVAELMQYETVRSAHLLSQAHSRVDRLRRALEIEERNVLEAEDRYAQLRAHCEEVGGDVSKADRVLAESMDRLAGWVSQMREQDLVTL